jgi:hypothetical protein
MEKQRGGGKAEIQVLSGSWIYLFCRRTQTTHNQPYITFSVFEIADDCPELGILKKHTIYKLLP